MQFQPHRLIKYYELNEYPQIQERKKVPVSGVGYFKSCQHHLFRLCTCIVSYMCFTCFACVPGGSELPQHNAGGGRHLHAYQLRDLEVRD